MSHEKIVLDASAFICALTIDARRREGFLQVFNCLWTQFIG
jgi:hypothetical protein